MQLFNEGLNQSAVASLYMEFRRQAVIHPAGQVMPTGEPAARLLITVWALGPGSLQLYCQANEYMEVFRL